MAFNSYPKHKYGAKRVEYDHHSFASQLEAALYKWLKLREQNGEIRDIKAQEAIYLTDARIMFKPDFSYVENDTNLKIFAEAKGMETSDYRIKRRLWKAYGPAPLQVYKGSAKNFKLFETVVPGGKNESDSD